MSCRFHLVFIWCRMHHWYTCICTRTVQVVFRCDFGVISSVDSVCYVWSYTCRTHVELYVLHLCILRVHYQPEVYFRVMFRHIMHVLRHTRNIRVSYVSISFLFEWTTCKWWVSGHVYGSCDKTRDSNVASFTCRVVIFVICLLQNISVDLLLDVPQQNQWNKCSCQLLACVYHVNN